MARYEKVFSLAPMLYTQGSPVIIEAGALHKDTTNSNIIAQLKFKSISNKDIKALTVELAPIDAFDNKIDEAVKHQYLDLKVKRNQEFASKEAIAMPNNSTRAFDIKSINVMFADGTNQVIENANWESLPTQENLELKDYEKEYYSKKYKTSNKFKVVNYKDLWLCTCGNINSESEEECFKCGNKKGELTDLETFKNEALDYKTEKEARLKKETEEKRVREEKLAEEKKEKAKKTKLIFSVIVAIAVVIASSTVLYLNVIQPKLEYNKAMNLIANEDYDSAYVLLENLNYKDSNDQANQIKANNPTNLHFKSTGDIVTMGCYANEQIEWIVLDKKDNEILVITKNIIECKEYTDEYTDVTWENSSIRSWLNNDLYNNAFSDDEKAIIQTTNVVDEKYDTSSGNDTQDKVFLLSVDEANLYFTNDSERECQGTNHAKNNDLYVSINGNSNWWLRTSGDNRYKAAFVSYSDGGVNEYGSYATYSVYGVRPAMWIEVV